MPNAVVSPGPDASCRRRRGANASCRRRRRAGKLLLRRCRPALRRDGLEGCDIGKLSATWEDLDECHQVQRPELQGPSRPLPGRSRSGAPVQVAPNLTMEIARRRISTTRDAARGRAGSGNGRRLRSIAATVNANCELLVYVLNIPAITLSSCLATILSSLASCSLSL
jgi:hypothetical protein